MSEFTFSPIVDTWKVIFLVALLVVPLFLRPDFASLTDTRRWILNGLRIVLILLLLVAILRPTILHTEKKPQPSAMVVMLDLSRSMSLTDLPGSRSRWDGMKDTLRAVEPHLAALAKKVTVRAYGFDRGAIPLEFDVATGKIKFPEKPGGAETDHGGSLDDIRKNETGQRLAATFLFGDGAQAAYSPRTPAQQVAAQFADQGTPLYSLVYGQVRSERDVAVENLQDQYSVFVKNQLPVKAQVRIQGYANQEIPVRVTVTDAEQKKVWSDVQRVKALPDEQGAPLEVEFNFVPEKQGQYKLTLSADLQPEELVAKNNELTAFVTVLDGGMRVLYLESSLEWWEPKFLRRALDTSRDIKLDFVWIDRRHGDKGQGNLATVLAAQEYDVYIIGDVHSSLIGQDNLKKIAAEVDKGKGLLMLGGYYTFDPGGYQDTPLEKVLPVTMEKNRRQGLDEPIIEQFHLAPAGGIAMLPSGEHFITDLMPGAANLELWKKLPKLDRAFQFAGLSLRSRVLAQSADEKPVPLMVAGVYGGGRTLAMAGNSTWHWAMQGHNAQHTRFWRRTMLWLAGKDVIREDVWIDLAQRRFNPGAKVTFTAGIKNSESEVVRDAQAKAELLLPDGKTQPIPLTSKDGNYEGTIPKMTTTGDHVILFTAKRGEKVIGSARARFTVFDQDLELGNPSANPSFLQQLSRITEKHGGRLVASEDLPALLTELEKAPPKNEVEVRSKWQLADTPLDAWSYFLVVIAFLSVEWYLRKLWGMA